MHPTRKNSLFEALALAVLVSCGAAPDQPNAGDENAARSSTPLTVGADLGTVTLDPVDTTVTRQPNPEIGTLSLQVDCQNTCDSAVMAEEKKRCETTCPASVKRYYGDTYGWSCSPDKTCKCTYQCNAIPPKAKGMYADPYPN
jgi:hypothetical protein